MTDDTPHNPRLPSVPQMLHALGDPEILRREAASLRTFAQGMTLLAALIDDIGDPGNDVPMMHVMIPETFRPELERMLDANSATLTPVARGWVVVPVVDIPNSQPIDGLE